MPGFLTAFNVSQAIAGMSEKALIVLPMVLLIIAREIDLSVASTLALTSVVFGVLVQAKVTLRGRHRAGAAGGRSSPAP